MGGTIIGDPYTTSVKYLKKVGPRRAEQLARLKIYTVHDLLYHFPREYIDRSQPVSPFDKTSGEIVTVTGKVLTGSESRPRKNLNITKLAMETDGGIYYAVWFNQAHVKKQIKTGDRLLISGRLKKDFGHVHVQVDDYEILTRDSTLLHSGRIVPVYALTSGLSQRMIRSFIHDALEQWQDSYCEFLPEYLIRDEGLVPLPSALVQIHFPGTIDEMHRARRRFIFEEFFLAQIQLANLRHAITQHQKSHRYKKDGSLLHCYYAGLEFNLTPAQRRVVDEITADLDKPYPMNRLLQGDVGSGKTVVGVITLLRAVESGLQGVMMAPTEVLAEQHYLYLCRSLHLLGVRVALLSGGISGRDRAEILKSIRLGEVDIVVGTHAILQDDVVFKNLAVVIIDEQHRFGVRQRGALQGKGSYPDVLIMTATPIPRTLSMTVYGDLDVSVIDTLPPGRQPVRTYFVSPDQLPGVLQFIVREVNSGKQAYVVCPLVEESEKLDLRAAAKLYGDLAQGDLRGCRVALLHGRMKRIDKERVMNSFRDGDIDVLVSTTVIEVGVDVPNASVMVIMDADRFGLSQLHQLRGRVGRGDHQSHCILIARIRSREAAERIKAMKDSQDGFYLAEKDLQIRGPGDISGVKQSGLPEFRLADLLRDRDLLAAARSRAAELVARDPGLTSREHRLLRLLLQRLNKNNSNYYHIS